MVLCLASMASATLQSVEGSSSTQPGASTEAVAGAQSTSPPTIDSGATTEGSIFFKTTATNVFLY